jgi:hypothetical protein
MRMLDSRGPRSRRLSAWGLTALLVVGALVLPGVRAQDKVKPGTNEAPVDRPKVLSVQPTAGAIDVDPETELRIRFDRAMDPNRVQLEWGHGEAGFRVRGAVHYDAAAREFVLPVWLTPGSRHEITAGAIVTFPGVVEGFESADHVAAAPFTWSFTTATPVARAGTPPHVLAVDPASDSELALFTPVTVKFDTPMDPNHYGVSEPGPRDPFRGGATLVSAPDYSRESQSFTLLLGLPANWNGEIVLSGFRSKEGVEAAPLTLRYRTLRRAVAESLTTSRPAVPEVGLKVVEEAREARRKLTSVSEVVRTVNIHSVTSSDWDQRYDVREARFSMQGDRAFVGEVDTIMGTPFRVGCDGKTCWRRMRDGLVVAPFEAIDEKNLRFCDPFDARGASEAAQVVRALGLVYDAKPSAVAGRPCHVFRSLKPGDVADDMSATIGIWQLDAETHLVARVETLMSSFGHRWSYSMEFTYTELNQPMPEEAFRPPSGPGEPARKEPEQMEEGYTRRFLNVSDGSNGRMSVRWGMKGPKGTMSSGLN